MHACPLAKTPNPHPNNSPPQQQHPRPQPSCPTGRGGAGPPDRPARYHRGGVCRVCQGAPELGRVRELLLHARPVASSTQQTHPPAANPTLPVSPSLQHAINISYMSVSRTAKGVEAIMAIGVDEPPSAAVLKTIQAVKGVQEVTTFSEKRAV